MVRKSLLVAALIALAMPVSAQEDYVWTSRRPDGHAPVGVMGARTLEKGEIEVGYRYAQFDSKGIWFDSDSVAFASLLEVYETVPMTLSDQRHQFSLAFGVTDDVSVTVNGAWRQLERVQAVSEVSAYSTRDSGLGDTEAAVLYRFFNQGGIRAHVQMGALLPTGEEGVQLETPYTPGGQERLPYDQRRGGGVYALLPGMTVSIQNEKASVGLQMKGNLPVDESNIGYAPGNLWEATGWGAYRLNEFFSVSGRVRWLSWSGIDGADPYLDDRLERDPGNYAAGLNGERIDLPVGVNFSFPEGSRFEGHRLSVEGFFPVSHDYEGLQFGMDWGMMVGWKVVF